MPTIADRFGEAPLSRFIVTNLQTETVTFLDRIATNRSAIHTRNAPFALAFNAPSDHPEVNLPSPDPSTGSAIPFRNVDEGRSLIYWFLRWGRDLVGGSPAKPWECMGAAIILRIEDSATSEGAPTSRVEAFDAWKLLYRAPVLDEDGEIRDPIRFPAETRASDIALVLLQRIEVFRPDFQTHLIVDEDNFADTEPLDDPVEFQAGTSVGEAFDFLVQTGTIDIYMRPIYDPVTHPGKINYIETADPDAAVLQPEAIFGWDRWPRSLVGITRQQDGEQRANVLQYYAGIGGVPILPYSDVGSIVTYGEYWEQQHIAATAREAIVTKMAQKELALRASGKFSYTLTPAAERAPLPLKEYNIGHLVNAYASRRLRQPISGETLRVEQIPFAIDDDQLARVQSLLVSVVEGAPA